MARIAYDANTTAMTMKSVAAKAPIRIAANCRLNIGSAICLNAIVVITAFSSSSFAGDSFWKTALGTYAQAVPTLTWDGLRVIEEIVTDTCGLESDSICPPHAEQ